MEGLLSTGPTPSSFQLTVGFASCVHCHLFNSDTSLQYLFCFFGYALTLLVQVDWASGIALGVPTFRVKSYPTYLFTSGRLFLTLPASFVCFCIVLIGD